MLVRGAGGKWHHFLISQYLLLLFTTFSSKSIPIPESRLDWRNMWRIVEHTYNNPNMVRDFISFFCHFKKSSLFRFLHSYSKIVELNQFEAIISIQQHKSSIVDMKTKKGTIKYKHFLKTLLSIKIDLLS